MVRVHMYNAILLHKIHYSEPMCLMSAENLELLSKQSARQCILRILPDAQLRRRGQDMSNHASLNIGVVPCSKGTVYRNFHPSRTGRSSAW